MTEKLLFMSLFNVKREGGGTDVNICAFLLFKLWLCVVPVSTPKFLFVF